MTRQTDTPADVSGIGLMNTKVLPPLHLKTPSLSAAGLQYNIPTVDNFVNTARGEPLEGVPKKTLTLFCLLVIFEDPLRACGDFAGRSVRRDATFLKDPL